MTVNLVRVTTYTYAAVTMSMTISAAAAATVTIRVADPHSHHHPHSLDFSRRRPPVDMVSLRRMIPRNVVFVAHGHTPHAPHATHSAVVWITAVTHHRHHRLARRWRWRWRSWNRACKACGAAVKVRVELIRQLIPHDCDGLSSSLSAATAAPPTGATSA